MHNSQSLSSCFSLIRMLEDSGLNITPIWLTNRLISDNELFEVFNLLQYVVDPYSDNSLGQKLSSYLYSLFTVRHSIMSNLMKILTSYFYERIICYNIIPIIFFFNFRIFQLSIRRKLFTLPSIKHLHI